MYTERDKGDKLGAREKMASEKDFKKVKASERKTRETDRQRTNKRTRNETKRRDQKSCLSVMHERRGCTNGPA